MSLPRQPSPHGKFNEKRNTSRVWPVPEGAAGVAIAALRRAREQGEEWYEWIANGMPRLRPDEYDAIKRREQQKKPKK